MNKQQRAVQFAVMCLQELDAQGGKALSFNEISQRRNIPIPECTSVIERLSNAGIVELAAGLVVLRRPVEELTALDVLRAVWSTSVSSPAFQAMVGSNEASRHILAYVNRQAEATING